MIDLISELSRLEKISLFLGIISIILGFRSIYLSKYYEVIKPKKENKKNIDELQKIYDEYNTNLNKYFEETLNKLKKEKEIFDSKNNFQKITKEQFWNKYFSILLEESLSTDRKTFLQDFYRNFYKIDFYLNKINTDLLKEDSYENLFYIKGKIDWLINNAWIKENNYYWENFNKKLKSKESGIFDQKILTNDINDKVIILEPTSINTFLLNEEKEKTWLEKNIENNPNDELNMAFEQSKYLIDVDWFNELKGLIDHLEAFLKKQNI